MKIIRTLVPWNRHDSPAVVFLLCFLFLSLSAAPFSASAGVNRTQTIALHKGWNSVYLEVTPANLDPAVVFSNTPVTMAATRFLMETPVEFIQNPAAIQWKKDGWGVWYAPNRSDAFLTSLHALDGNRSYLIYSRQEYTWQVDGAVVFQPLKWKPSSFNLVGFTVSQQAPPTFDKFFAGSAAHKPYRIFRLVNDQWTQVTDPVHTAMRAGEACWIYCNGGSDYQGPLQVKLPAGREFALTDGTQSGMSLANQSTDPLGLTVETVSSDAGLPLAYLMRAVGQGKMVDADFDLPANYALPTLDPGSNTSLWLTLRRERMTSASQATLLKISTDSGVEVWVPVTGTRTDLPSSATPAP